MTQSPHQSLRARTKTQYDKLSEVKRVQLYLNESKSSQKDSSHQMMAPRGRESRSPIVMFARESLSGKNACMKPPTAALISRSGAGIHKPTETAEVVPSRLFYGEQKSPNSQYSNNKHVRKISSGKTPFMLT